MTEAPARVLVVDDEENMVHFLTMLLRGEGFEVEGAGTGEAALEKLRAGPFELVLTDLKLPDTDGIEILKAARELHPETVVVLITAYGTIGSAIEAMRAGAYDYVTKPFRASEILQAVEKAFERVRLRREVAQLRQAVAERFAFANLVGKSPKMQDVYVQIEKLAASRGAVLIQGESGTGKELVAKAIHFNGPRKSGPFELVLTDLKLPDTDGIEILKAARELHPETVVRGGARRLALPGRSGGDGSWASGQAPPRPPGRGAPACGGDQDAPRGHAGHRSHQPRPRRRGPGGRLPAGSLLSPECVPRLPCPAPGTGRGPPSARRPLPPAFRP
ncbi:MAG: response regulator [Candidatus Rokubacteria bacterium]|nr:response regulator [Candidatus Rokubacteria bacterium]